jgi:hypothetical protein
MKNVLLSLTLVGTLASQLFAAEKAVLIDIKSPIVQKISLEPALTALRICINEDERFKVVASGSDWKIWLQDYRRFDNGETYSVSLKMSLVAPSAPDRKSPLSVADVTYRFPKEPRDILTTEDSITRFLRGKATDFGKEKLAELNACYPSVSDAFRRLIPAMREFEVNRTQRLKLRSQDL